MDKCVTGRSDSDPEGTENPDKCEDIRVGNQWKFEFSKMS